MIRILPPAAATALAVALSAPAHAGVLADDLSRCLVTRATDSDNSAIMAWMFSAISSDPKLQRLTSLDRSKRDAISASAAAVFQRLLVVDCRKEAVAALKAEGKEAMTASFGALGEAATEQMFHSREAQAELESLGKNFDAEKLKELGREAGIEDKSGK